MASPRLNHGNIDKRGETADLPYMPFPNRPFQLIRGNMEPSTGLATKRSGKKKKSAPTAAALPAEETNGKLPRLKHTVSSRRKTPSTTNLAELVEKTRVAQTTSTSSDASSKSLTGIRLHDDLAASISTLRLHSRGNPRNGLIFNQPITSATLLHVSALATRSLSSGNIQEATSMKEKSDPDLVRSSPSLRDTKDIATQTHDRRKSTMKVEFEDEEEEEEDEDKSLIVRGTQTDQAPLLLTGRRRSEMIPPEELEERGALLEIIEDALDQTIDRYSRVRANQVIAASARRQGLKVQHHGGGRALQAQIWRDAKDFISTTLLPQSIQMANKSKAQHQTAAQIVANIRMYP